MPGLLPGITRELDASIQANQSNRQSRLKEFVSRELAWSTLSTLVGGCAIVTFVTAGLWIQYTTYLNHDVAWILYSAAQLLDGGVFGRDVIAANPPLAWYLSYPAVICAEMSGANPADTFRIYIGLLSVSILTWCGSLLRRSPRQVRAGGELLLVVAAAAFFVCSYRDFGQREYLTLLLVLPYLLLTAARLSGYAANRFEAIFIGLLAGIAISLKPHFLGVPLLVELTAMLYARRATVFVRPEVICGLLVITGYAVFLTLFVPDYIFTIVPICRKTYWGFNQDLPRIIYKLRFETSGFLVLAVMLIRRPRLSPLLPILIAAAAGFFLAYVSQRKGYSYHAFPFRSLVLISLGYLLGNLQWHGRTQHKGVALASWLVGSALLGLVLVGFARTSSWYLKNGRVLQQTTVTADSSGEPRELDSLINLLNQRSKTDSFLALSTHPYPGFPTALYVKPRWASRTNSRIFVPAIARMRAAGVGQESPTLRLAESTERQYVLRDLREKPAVVLVDRRQKQHGIGKSTFDILEFYQEDPTFRKLWSQYRELPTIGSLRVFELHEGA